MVTVENKTRQELGHGTGYSEECAARPACPPLSKGASELLTLVILFAIIVTAITIVLISSQPTIDAALSTTDIKNAENILKILDNNIKETAVEGPNSTRVVAFTSPRDFETIPEEDAVQFRTVTGAFEHLTRVFSGNVVYIAGSDVSCDERDGDGDGDTDLVVENTFIKAVFLRVPAAQPYSSYDTAGALLSMTNKINSRTVVFSNSSVVVDDNVQTTAGNGYSEISNAGNALPLCQVHFFMNSTSDYDVYYKLYAGSDFMVMDVRNIR